MSCEPLAPGRHARRTATPIAARARALAGDRTAAPRGIKNTAVDGAHNTERGWRASPGPGGVDARVGLLSAPPCYRADLSCRPHHLCFSHSIGWSRDRVDAARAPHGTMALVSSWYFAYELVQKLSYAYSIVVTTHLRAFTAKY